MRLGWGSLAFYGGVERPPYSLRYSHLDRCYFGQEEEQCSLEYPFLVKPREHFILRPGEEHVFTDENGVKHVIGVSRFSTHDHKHKPVYHPLSENENPRQLVVTLQSDPGALPPSYPAVYASCVRALWTACRGQVAFFFEYHEENGTEFISCDVRPNPFFGIKLGKKGKGVS